MRKQSEPFRIKELLTVATDNLTSKNHCSKIISATKIPLIRFISGSQEPIFPQQESITIKCLCLPPESLMILKE
jgi:hypothetical protein